MDVVQTSTVEQHQQTTEDLQAIQQQRKQLIAEIQTLPADLLPEAADIISRLREKVAGLEVQQSVEESSSTYEAFKKSGFIGCGEKLSDLAANHKEYLAEGWKD